MKEDSGDNFKIGDRLVVDNEDRVVIGFTAAKGIPGRALITERVQHQGEAYEPCVPRGWTILIHGTNLIKWGDENPFTSDRITVHKELSVVTSEDAELSRHQGLSSTSESYSKRSKPLEMDEDEFQRKNKQFEIRIYFYQNHARTLVDEEYRKTLDDATKKEIARYYYDNRQLGRHPLVPRGITLIKLAHVKENDRDVFYYVPENLLTTYVLESRNIQKRRQ